MATLKSGTLFLELQRLAAAIQAGDTAAEEEFVETFRPRLLLMLCKRVGNRHDAEDLCQGALVVALQALRAGTIDHPELIGAFLWRTAENLWRSSLRRSARLAPEPIEDLQLRASSELPDTQLIEAERLRIEAWRLNRALARLTSIDRDIVRSTYVQMLPTHEICRRLGITESVLYVRRHRALERLRALYLDVGLRPGGNSRIKRLLGVRRRSRLEGASG